MVNVEVKIISDHDSDALAAQIANLYSVGYKLVGSVSATVAGTLTTGAHVSGTPTVSISYLYMATLIR